jgi:hypothetical protein
MIHLSRWEICPSAIFSLPEEPVDLEPTHQSLFPSKAFWKFITSITSIKISKVRRGCFNLILNAQSRHHFSQDSRCQHFHLLVDPTLLPRGRGRPGTART